MSALGAITTWQQRLLQQSWYTPLLAFAPAGQSTLQLLQPSYAALFDSLVHEQQPFAFALHEAEAAAPGMLLTNHRDEALTAALQQLQLRQQTALQERGAPALFVAFGLLRWQEAGRTGEVNRSPLLFVPVRLGLSAVLDPYRLVPLDMEPLLNPLLLHDLWRDPALALPKWSGQVDRSLSDFLDEVEAQVSGRGWQVVREAWLGAFDLWRPHMYHALGQQAEHVGQHPLVVALAGDSSAMAPAPERTPNGAAPPALSLPLAADVSQQAAILAANQGISLVLQGPPGTGKSQSIANIIVAHIASGKRVLFVAHKMAALEVVYRRLQQVGIAARCLPLFGDHMARSGLAQALVQRLSYFRNHPWYGYRAPDSSPEALRDVAAHLQELHTLLDALVEALYAPAVSHGFTPTASLDGLRRLVEYVTLCEELTARYRPAIFAVETTACIAGLTAGVERAMAAFRAGYVDSADALMSRRGELLEFLQWLIEVGERLSQAAADLAALLSVQAPSTIVAIRRLLDLAALVVTDPQPLPHWFDADHYPQLCKTAEEGQARYDHLLEQEELLFGRYDKQVLSLNIPALLQRFQADYTALLRYIIPRYYQDGRALRTFLKRNVSLSDAQVRADLQLMREILRERYQIAMQEAQMIETFGGWYRGAQTRWDSVLDALQTVAKIVAHFEPDEPPAALCEMLTRSGVTIKEVEAAMRRVNAALTPTLMALEQVWVRASFGEVATAADRASEIPLQTVLDWAQQALASLSATYEAYDAFGAQSHRFFDRSVADLLADAQMVARAQELQAELAPTAPAPEIVTALAAAIRSSEGLPRLDRACQEADYVADLFEPGVVNLMQQPLQAVQDWLTYRLQHVAALAEWIEFRSALQDQEMGSGLEMAAHLQAVAERRRLMPIRQMLATVAPLLPILVPCVLAPPLLVSYLLADAQHSFDLIIIDEASQIAPEDAIATLSCGNQVVVAGDSHQLPPIELVANRGNGEPSDRMERAVSVLDLYSAILPQYPLQQHYRSRHEHLIACSKAYLYPELTVRPGLIERAPGQGVELIHVPTRSHDRSASGTSKAEAERVAHAVFAHLRRFPDRSLGVVTFGEAQRLLIEAAIRWMRMDNQAMEPFFDEARPEPFFIKLVEHVQGDERDSIILSLSAAGDRGDSEEIDPLRGDDGYRWLNVAITRARYQLVLVTSLQEADIASPAAESSSAMLRTFLQIAAHGPEIGPAERATAMLRLLHQTDGISPEALIQQTGRLLGIEPLDEQAQERLLDALDALLATGQARWVDDRIGPIEG